MKVYHPGRMLAALCFCMAIMPVWANQAQGSLIAQGVALRERGDIALSIQTLTQARDMATSPAETVQAAGELGASLFQARRYADADAAFMQAYNGSEGVQKARFALDRGNVAAAQKHPEQAQALYAEAQSLAPDDPLVTAGCALNLARLAPEEARLALLAAIPAELAAITDLATQARYRINLGNQAHALGPAGTRLAYEQYSAAQAVLQAQGSSRLQVEALDGLAQLYEDQGRFKESLQINQQALQMANGLEASSVPDLLITLYWRQGRLQVNQGDDVAALVSYQRAVDVIESIRLDIPIEYDDGRSSYKALLEPVYIGLADLLLKSAAGQPPAQQQPLLQRVSNTTELLKQTEMQDFLGDRCAIEEIKGAETSDRIAQDTAVFYPLVFDDRTELLLLVKGVMTRFSVPVGREALHNEVVQYDELLRYQEDNYLDRSRHLYDLLVRPAAATLKQHGIRNLIVVPDSSLRIVPFGSLHDGQQYLVETFAIASVAGLSMTTIGEEGVIDSAGMDKSLVVGMSTPGPVVEKLAAMEMASDSADADPSAQAEKQAFSLVRSASLKKDLALPGVDKEMTEMNGVLNGASLKNEGFTLDNFTRKVNDGNYQILHIASHGVFGGTEDTSYIMTYDNIIKMNDLQKILDTGRAKKQHIRLLTLSACQTAEGSEAAPIGISGAAIKARARSVLGTLWPVEDSSAQTFMKLFYKGVAENALSKAAAVQQAQVAMIRSPELNHPFFWAPFTLIGNWQ